MWEILASGGWLMLPILGCSVAALAIIIERAWSLRENRLFPEEIRNTASQIVLNPHLTEDQILRLKGHSALGQVLAAGLEHREALDTDIAGELEHAGRGAVLEMERHLNLLGIISAITPLLGLLGTVIGMIKVFSVIVAAGVGNPEILAGGISEALVTTAAGLVVAIPSLFCYRVFQRKVDVLTARLQEEAKHILHMISNRKTAEAH